MSDREPEPGSPSEEPGEEAGPVDEASEAALIRKVLRVQERHREGGVDPELDVGEADEDRPAGS